MRLTTSSELSVAVTAPTPRSTIHAQPPEPPNRDSEVNKCRLFCASSRAELCRYEVRAEGHMPTERKGPSLIRALSLKPHVTDGFHGEGALHVSTSPPFLTSLHTSLTSRRIVCTHFSLRASLIPPPPSAREIWLTFCATAFCAPVSKETNVKNGLNVKNG